MQHIVVNNPSSQDPSLLQSVKCGPYFNAFVESKKRKPGSLKGLTSEGAVTFVNETLHILNHCNPHDSQNPETTHLAVGYVQSGKTMSFTGLTALALDNGYRMVIYLAGTKNNLLKQTKDRLTKDLVDNLPGGRKKFKLHPSPSESSLNSILGHLESIDKPIILVPVLKHHGHIKKFIRLVKHPEFAMLMKNESVLIIDDEADQASLNNYGRKNSLKSRHEEEEMSSTYSAILQMRAALPLNSYIQYTATPQANILISLQDLLSPKTHTLLHPGEGYVGGKLFFGKGANGDLYRGRLVMSIPDEEVYHPKDNPLTQMPNSLKEAMMLHILAVALQVCWKDDNDIDYLSMMVHPATRIESNKMFKTWIDNTLAKWQKALRKPDGQDDKEYLYADFKRLYPEAVRYMVADNEPVPSFDELRPYIKEAVNDHMTYLINTDKDANTEIDWSAFKTHILVGAEMLNRGFTVENLTTTYMPRYAKGVTNADTIQQRCRFFGYKMPYIKSCRVYLPESSIEQYIDYVEHEEELRSKLEVCSTLEEAEHKILLDSSLHPTRTNVLPYWVVKERLSGMRPMQAFASEGLINANSRYVESFLEEHQNDFDILFDGSVYGSKDSTPDRTHRAMRLSIDEAIMFLNDFNFKNFNEVTQKANTIRYLRYLANNNDIDYVYFVQMAYNSTPRERSFDQRTCRFSANTQLFAGASTNAQVSYPGDQKVTGALLGDDAITIQLHHVFLKGHAIGFPATAYTLAIYYPEFLSTNFYETKDQTQYYYDEDE